MGTLATRLDKLVCDSCTQVSHETLGAMTGLGVARSALAYHFTRLYPGLAAWLPRHVPRLLPALAHRLALQHGGKD